MRKKILLLGLLAACVSCPVQTTAYAGFFSGLGRTVLAPLQIPIAMLQQGPISGAISGTYNAVSGVAGGVGEMASGATSTAVSAAQAAAPYAKYAWVPFVL